MLSRNLVADGLLEGRIVLISDTGLACVAEKQNPARVYPFTFDKLRYYGGEPLADLGLSIGSEVSFRLDGGVVSLVEVPPVEAASESIVLGAAAGDSPR